MTSVLLQLSSVDPSSIMYLFGLLFGALSVLYFAKDILLSLSITVKSYALFVLASFIFSTSFLFTDSPLYILLIALSGIAYSVAVLYTWNSNPLKRTYRFLLLMLSSLLFIGVATGVQSNLFSQNTTAVISFSGFLFVVFILLSVLDTREEDPVTSEVSVENDIEVDDEIVVGSVDIKNDGLFRRRYEKPDFEVLYKQGEQTYDIPFTVENGEGTIGRKSDLSLEITGNVARYNDPRSESEINLPDQLELESFEDGRIVLE